LLLSGQVVLHSQVHSLEKAESYAGSRKRKPKKAAKAVPHLLKALKDKRNLDALIQVAFLNALPDAIEVLEYAEGVGAFAVNEFSIENTVNGYPQAVTY
jgi:hypothetical protein